MISKEAFFKRYHHLDYAAFGQSGLPWEDLEEIYRDFEQYRHKLQQHSNSIFGILMMCEHIHSVRYRVKDSEHLIEKVIRKRLEAPDRIIGLDNYKEEMDDLLGFRVLHMMKEDWLPVHKYILKEYDLKGTPVANHRAGDDESILIEYKNNGCDTKIHKAGYRSVHYTIKLKPGKDPVYAEVQVRTIFEEGWAEIDHNVRYPYNTDNPILENYLKLFNRVTGIADEMASFISAMNEAFDQRNREINKQKGIVRELQQQVEKLTVQADQQAAIHRIKQNISDLEASHQRISRGSPVIRLNEIMDRRAQEILTRDAEQRLHTYQNSISRINDQSEALARRQEILNKLSSGSVLSLPPDIQLRGFDRILDPWGVMLRKNIRNADSLPEQAGNARNNTEDTPSTE
ncbi:MAG TPA: hypothetical protein VM802_07030 [Chitinophaga sp.]|uniref:RelA/SpoT domain-containing protein n=1 Tax=Chitinophaga sp. TaxID=1869181 RepID=UPI002C0A7905|nr:hypothetical protein [Chitinophaga sp.]HVI44603.1 hypothetical protein [Chitinophaga sp.]